MADTSAKANEAKKLGNAAYTKKDYAAALGHFTEAIPPGGVLNPMETGVVSPNKKNLHLAVPVSWWVSVPSHLPGWGSFIRPPHPALRALFLVSF